jgi:hypothetical protein
MEETNRGLGLDLGGSGVGFKQICVLLGLVFAVTLAVLVAKQMGTEAMAVVIGVVCGVAAGIPTSVLMLVLVTRRDRQQDENTLQKAKQGSVPPVVVIQGGAPQALPQGMQAGYWPAPSPGPPVPRQFQVVGGDDLIVDG